MSHREHGSYFNEFATCDDRRVKYTSSRSIYRLLLLFHFCASNPTDWQTFALPTWKERASMKTMISIEYENIASINLLSYHTWWISFEYSPLFQSVYTCKL